MCGGKGLCVRVCISMYMYMYTPYTYRECAQSIQRVCRTIHVCSCIYIVCVQQKGKGGVDVTVIPCLPLLDYDGGINTLWLGHGSQFNWLDQLTLLGLLLLLLLLWLLLLLLCCLLLCWWMRRLAGGDGN